MMPSDVREIVIVGAGAAAAAAAAAMAVSLQGSGIGITLLLSPITGSSHPVAVAGGGPQSFHTKLGIEESTLCQQTRAVHGMGTRYHGLLESAEAVFVPLGSHGATLRLVDFHHYIAKLRIEGEVLEFNDWSRAAAAAQAGRFVPAQTGVEPALRLIEYDLYVDDDSYRAAMLKQATNLGIKIIEQTPVNVHLDAAGMLEHVTLADHSILRGDFFIDCSPERFLIGNLTTEDKFRDWSSWFPFDRIASLAARPQSTPDLFTSIRADEAGWITQLTTQQAMAGTFVYDSAQISDKEAIEKLAKYLPNADSDNAQADRLKPGRYSKHWEKNCVAIGPAAAALPPMEVSPLKWAHESVLRLVSMLPRRKGSSMLAAHFNRLSNAAIDSARDYQLLRLALADRKSGPYWQNRQQLQWPESLQQRIDLFRSRGRFTPHDNDFFTKSNWVSSFLNLGCWPSTYDSLADLIDEQRMRADLNRLRKIVQADT